MKPLSLVFLFLVFMSPIAWCDNEVGGDDMPWEGEPPSDISETYRDSVSQSFRTYYDLSGRIVTNPKPGTIYIVNGKKIIKK